MPVTREVPVEYETDDVVQQRMAAWDLEFRAKYSQSEIDDLGKKGQAFGPDDDGHYSYPIADEDDLKSAIKAVGRGNADHDALRKFIIGRAKDLKADDEIPDTWNSDGSLKQANAKSEPCNRCDGKGTVILNGDEKECPQCGGTGSGANNADKKALSKSVEWRKKRALELRGAERRTHLEKVEFRDNADGSLHLSGYASVTNTPYDMGWYSESISRGAFAKTLAENPDVQLLVNHAGLPLARTKSGTLRLSEDNTGLRVDADLDPEDPDVQSLSRKMKRGDIDQMSFAFRAVRQSWDEDYTDRQITECDIHRGDVSVVNQGANPSTSSSIRAADALQSLRHLGQEGFAEGMWEWLRYRCSPREARVGKQHSNATVEVLTQVLNLCAISDDAMDQAQPLLAELLGVENPDDLDAYGQTKDDTACEACGGMNDSDAQYCDQCGAAMNVDDTSDDSDDDELDSARGLSLALEARRRMEALRYPKKGAA